jgi:hypothetical protein
VTGRSGLKFRLSIAVLAIASTAALLPASAEAAFPGQNGKIAFSCPLICTMNPDGTGRTAVTSILGRDAAWSADGTKIAFTAPTTTGDKIYVVVFV